MTADTTTEPLSELELYRKRVYAEALSVAASQNWPDEDLNITLRALGFPEKQTFNVPIEITLTRRVMVKVDDASSLEDAISKIRSNEDDRLAAYMPNRRYTFVSADVREPDPSNPRVGDPDTTSALRGTPEGGDTSSYCSHTDPSRRWNCSLGRHHTLPFHLAGDGAEIRAVWPIATLTFD